MGLSTDLDRAAAVVRRRSHSLHITANGHYLLPGIRLRPLQRTMARYRRGRLSEICQESKSAEM